MTGLSRTLFALAAIALTASATAAQNYPSKPITMVIPFAPGGSVDAVARILKPHLEERLGQPLVIDYRAGAATTIGTASVSRAAPDGYTIGLVVEAHTVNPSLYKNLSYNTFTDFISVSLLGTMPLIIAVNAKSELDTLPKIVAAAKAAPQKVTYATVGSGSINQLAAELFGREAGITMTAVPYRGGGPAVNDLLGGHVNLMFMSAALAWPQLQSGMLKAVAVTSTRRLSILPDVPTVAESGIPDFEALAWQGMLVPAKTPSSVVERLQRDTQAVLAMPDVAKSLAAMGFVPVGSSSQEFADFIRKDADRWVRIIAETGIKPDN
jgi:tripartite-type tricarboxylate transporter receptor subunit TctC